MMKFDQQDIAQWGQKDHGRSTAVINTWRKMDISPTIKKLLDFLRQLQVKSLLRDPNFIEAIGKLIISRFVDVLPDKVFNYADVADETIILMT